MFVAAGRAVLLHYTSEVEVDSRFAPSSPQNCPAFLDSLLHVDAMVPDFAGGRFKIPGGGITNPRPGFGGKSTADVIDMMAKESVANGTGPLCYW